MSLPRLPPIAVLAGTGHRPNKLGGYDVDALQHLVDFARSCLAQLRPASVISGLALGWDQALALAAFDLDIPVVGAIPFAGQEDRWEPFQKVLYREIVRRCHSVQVVSAGGYSTAKMQIRNQWMVDRATHVGALWNGTSGGTANCVRYAQRQPRVEVINVWPNWLSFCSPKAQV